VQSLHALDTGEAGKYEFYRNSALSQLQKQLSKRERPAKTGLQVSMSRGPSRIGRGVAGRLRWTGGSCEQAPTACEPDETETTILVGCQVTTEDEPPLGITLPEIPPTC
jgi:hypothetical protein